MRSPILSFVVVAFLFNAGCASVATKSVDVEARIAAQNALFEEWYQADLQAHPEQATAYGDYRYNDRLDGRSLAALGAEHANDQHFVGRLKAIATTLPDLEGFESRDVSPANLAEVPGHTTTSPANRI